jgi:TolB-like protein/class 3 adenylate cyclase/Tfp pilus assembly protein PilF
MVTMNRKTRRLAAIMFTDIVNFTGLTQQDEAKALDLLSTHKGQLEPLFEQHHGRVIKMLGDGFLVIFDSALQASRCAIEIQKTLFQTQQEISRNEQVRIRIGIHLGDVEEHENDVFGDDVNIASRIESICPPGGICLSDDAARRVRGKLDFPLVGLGPMMLKNIKNPVEIDQIKLPWAEAPALHRRFIRFVSQPVTLGIVSALLVLTLGGWWALSQRDLNTSNNQSIAETNIGNGPIVIDNAAFEDVSTIRALAVLPFANLSPDEENEYFSDGLTEELINAFSRLESLRVISRTSVFAYKDKAMELTEIGEKLNVDAVLEGSVRKSGNTVRVTAQLINVATDAPLWSQTYEREVEDVFAIQDEITRAIVNTLRIQFIEGEEPAELVVAATENSEAYNLYLLGRFYWNKRTEDGFTKAVDYFQQALELDPNYAEAHAGLADSYSLLADYGFWEPDVAYPQAREAAMTALALDDSLADAHASLGLIHMIYEKAHGSAETEFQKALELNPSYASAHQWYSILLEEMGRDKEAQAQAELALNLDPLSPVINYNVGNRYQDAGQYQEALKQFEQALEVEPNYDSALWGKYAVQQRLWDQQGMEQTLLSLIKADPENPTPHSQYAEYLMWHGRREEASQEMKIALSLNDDEVAVLEDHAKLLYWEHRYEDAVEVATAALELNPHSSSALFTLSSANYQLGRDNDAASAYLQQLIQSGDVPEDELEAYLDDLEIKLEDFEFDFNFESLGNFLETFDLDKLIHLGIKSQINEELADGEVCGNDAYHVAVLYAISGEDEKSVVCLEAAFNQSEPGLFNVQVDPIFEKLRNEPRVIALLKKIGIDIEVPEEPEPPEEPEEVEG